MYDMGNFDPEKGSINLGKHSVSLSQWIKFDPVITYEDDRKDYGEKRYGHIDDLPYCFVFPVRTGLVRPISLRRAHKKEMRRDAPQNS